MRRVLPCGLGRPSEKRACLKACMPEEPACGCCGLSGNGWQRQLTCGELRGGVGRSARHTGYVVPIKAVASRFRSIPPHPHADFAGHRTGSQGAGQGAPRFVIPSRAPAACPPREPVPCTVAAESRVTSHESRVRSHSPNAPRVHPLDPPDPRPEKLPISPHPDAGASTEERGPTSPCAVLCGCSSARLCGQGFFGLERQSNKE